MTHTEQREKAIQWYKDVLRYRHLTPEENEKVVLSFKYDDTPAAAQMESEKYARMRKKELKSIRKKNQKRT